MRRLTIVLLLTIPWPAAALAREPPEHTITAEVVSARRVGRRCRVTLRVLQVEEPRRPSLRRGDELTAGASCHQLAMHQMPRGSRFRFHVRWTATGATVRVHGGRLRCRAGEPIDPAPRSRSAR